MTNDILEDVAEIIMGQSPASTTCNIDGVGIPLLNGPTEFGSHHPLAVQFTTDAKKIAKPGDILFCVRGSTTGRMNWSDQIYAIGRGIGAIRHKQGIEYQPLVRGVIECELSDLLTQATGSTFPNVSASQLSKIRWPVLDDAEQRRIAHILGTLDDKIENNRKTAKTLEAMAQAIFQSWFVDFDPVRAKMAGESKKSICKRLKLTPEILDLFPDRLVDSELGEIPEGWEVGMLGDLCKSVQSGGTPKRIVAEYWNGKIDWLTSGEVRNPIVFGTKEKITEAALAESNAKLWPAGTTVVAMYGATAGEVCLLASEMCTNQACCGLIPLPNYEAFLFFYVRNERRYIADKSSGSAQQNLNKGLIESHSCFLPVKSIITSFKDVASCILNVWIINERECDALIVFRDSLLPKLISGEIRVPEAEYLIENIEG